MKKTTLSLLLLLSSPLLAVDADKPASKTMAPAQSGQAAKLDRKVARQFIIENLKLIRTRDERIFTRLSDNNLLLTEKQTREFLNYKPKRKNDARFWRRIFPGYSRLPNHKIKYIKIISMYGPSAAELRSLAGGTKKKPLWKKIKARSVFVFVKIPGRVKEMNCRVYLVKNRLYWEPFGW